MVKSVGLEVHIAWHKTSASDRGYGAKWQKIRKRILKRDKYLCQSCLRACRITNLVTGDIKHPRNATVDHITPKHKGGTDHPTNLEALCAACHKVKTTAEAHGEEHVERAYCDAQGHPTDPTHHWNVNS